ncbi:MAG TPA: DUF2147 domain-containing protein [Pseudorhodoplanes sp.]|nr:DUF2147 domain-containing protein [Pseudorhodoplanes sp.]
MILKTIAIAILTALACSVTPAFAGDPHGVWISADRDTKVRIGDCGGKLCGRVVWLKEPIDPATGKPKTDKENPDATKQRRPLVGLQVINGMQASGRDIWQGQIYNADDGKTYAASLELQSHARARVEGCVMSVLCKAQTWTRAN